MGDLALRLAQIERVTAMLTPEYTWNLQSKLQTTFSSIHARVCEIDESLLTDGQKREDTAAATLQVGLACDVMPSHAMPCHRMPCHAIVSHGQLRNGNVLCRRGLAAGSRGTATGRR